MRNVVWTIAWILVAVWSLVAWASYGLIDVFGGWAIGNADIVIGDPELVDRLSWLLAALKSLGLAAVVAVWGLVSLAVLAVAWVVASLAAPRRPRFAEPHHPAAPRVDGPRDHAAYARDLVGRFNRRR